MDQFTSGTIFVIICLIILLIGVPLIYVTAHFYLDHLFCCCHANKRRQSYEDINGDITINLPENDADDDDVVFDKNQEDYIVEFDGFYYKRNTSHGSRHYLLGSSPTFSVSSNGSEDIPELKDNVSVEISSARSLDDPHTFWIRVDDVQFVNPTVSPRDVDQFKFKVKVYRLINNKKYVKKNLVVKLESEFMTQEDVKKHMFLIHTDDSQDSQKSFNDFMVQLKVRAKCGNQKTTFKLGHATVLLDNLDGNGNVFSQRKTLTDGHLKFFGGFLLDKPIL